MNYILRVHSVRVRADVSEFILLTMKWDLAKPNISVLLAHVKYSSHSLFLVHRTCHLIFRVQTTPRHQLLVSSTRQQLLFVMPQLPVLQTTSFSC